MGSKAAVEVTSITSSSSSSFATWERFNLLLLEDGEYYFRDHGCYLWKDGKRVAGQLKVCSMSLYFVPRDIQEPVLRLPYKHVSAIEALEDETLASGEGMFLVETTETVEMKAGEVHRPYQRHQGNFCLRFSLVYTSLEEVLPGVEDLCILAQQDGNKEEHAAAKEQLDIIIREHEENERFNPGWLEDDNEKVVLEMIGNCITALCSQPGRVVLTQHCIYFQPFNVVSSAPIQTYQLDKVMFVMRRVYQLEDLGVEVFFPGRASLYLTLRSTRDREAFIKALMQQPNLQLEHMRSRDKWTRDWVNGRISNFDYLMYLNREAGRSFKDLTQYPVFPWVIADYTSPTLDLTDPATFRDLTRPIGALNPERLKGFRERFNELKKMNTMAPGAGKGGKGNALSLDFPPPFLYGCHYSSPGYVVFYLMRSDPQLMLRLQNGRFDAPDRLFWSIQDSWKSVLTLPTDVKELIPEFYSNDASFLVNNNDIDFGTRSNGQRVGDVVLPPWATDAQDFVYKLAEALECPFVSSKLHKWINLVFGYKSRGPTAEAADNVFHYLTYDEIAAKYLEQEQDPVMREALRLQMMEFGRTPRQLFNKKHPKRRVGTSGLLACLACAPVQMRRPSQPVNTLLGKGWAGRNITPVSRAVFKLTSKKPARRAATLAWLEQTAATHEPGVLALRQGKGAELVLLVKFVRDAREGKNPHASGEEMTGVLVRSCKALAVAQQNRRYIMDAGALDLIVDALCSKQPELSLQALQALAAISKEDSDPHLISVDRRALAKVMEYLDTASQGEPMLAALTIVTHLATSTPNRTYFTDHGLLPRYLLPIFESLYHPPAPQQLTSLSNYRLSQAAPGPPGNAEAVPSQQLQQQQQPQQQPQQPQQQQQQPQQQSGPGLPAAPSSSGAPTRLPPLILPTSPATHHPIQPPPLSPQPQPQPLSPAPSPHSMRRSTTLMRPHTPRSALDAQRAANLRQCALAIAALLQDDAQKDLVLAPSSDRSPASSGSQDGARIHPAAGDNGSSSGEGRDSVSARPSGTGCGLDLILGLCRPVEQAQTQGAAYECLAALTTYDPVRQLVKERRLFPMLLQAATSGPGPVQRPAAAAVANVCADPQLAVAALPDQGGLAAMVAMALSPDHEVQRHAARALWHLVAQPDTRGKVVKAGALPALLGLARVTKRGVQARNLARQALRVCHEDPATRPALEAAALAAGVEVEELAVYTASQARISSHPSASNLQSGASPHAGSSSSLGMGAAHRRQPSDLRSAGGETEETLTASPGPSRWSSFTAGNLMAAAGAAGPAAAAAGSGQEPSQGQGPLRRGSAGAGEEATAAAAAAALAGPALAQLPGAPRSARRLSNLAPTQPAPEGPQSSGGAAPEGTGACMSAERTSANGPQALPSGNGNDFEASLAAYLTPSAAPCGDAEFEASLGPVPTLSASGMPPVLEAAALAGVNGAPLEGGQQQTAAAGGGGGKAGAGGKGSGPHGPPQQLQLAVDCLEEGQDPPAPIPIISPVAQATSSSAGSSPRQRWEERTQGAQQQQQRGGSPSRPLPQCHSAGKVADVVKKLERMASHQSQQSSEPEAHGT